MKLTWLGSGGPFTLTNFHSNAVLEVDGKLLLIDAGADLGRSLNAAQISQRDIRCIFTTHAHPDHAYGLAEVALKTKFDPDSGPQPWCELIAHEDVMASLWGLLSSACILPNQKASLEDFFLVRAIGNIFEWQGLHFELCRTEHCLNNGVWMPSFGLTWMGTNGKRIWLSGDTRLMNSPLFEGSDLIFHDCETGKRPTGVHAHYNELIKLPAEVRAKMWLYHYGDGRKPKCEKDGFAGWVKRGQAFEL